MTRQFRGAFWVPLAIVGVFALGAGATEAQTPSQELGPVDGHDLPGTDLERIAIGDVAPDFTLETYRGDRLTLSENRGQREILLVFYRGAW